MKIKTFKVADMRQGMRAIRQELGPDAVILATERTADGVMLTAATDMEAATRSPQQAERAGMGAGIRAPAAARETTDSALSEELRVLRRLLETQMAQLAWNEYSRRSPLLAELQREFAAAGFDAALLQGVLAEFPAGMAHGAARRLLMLRLADRLRSTGERWLEFGGRPVLLGSTGAGKTSAALRLAAKWVQRHGNRGVALITTDTRGYAATEQFAAQARMLGVPSYGVADTRELDVLMTTLADRRLVITDTAGLSGASEHAELAAWKDALATQPALEFVMVAAASVRADVSSRIMANTCAPPWQAALITKLDEADRTGELLAALIRHEIPLCYVTRGRRWLQDMAPARAATLVAEAVESASPDRLDASAPQRAEIA
jgi:flagellar biosynthesis protein FlhF